MNPFACVASCEEKKFYQALQSAMPSQGLFAEKSWRQSPEPFFISEQLHAKLERLGALLHLFNKACDLLYRQSVAGKELPWIAALLDRGKPKEIIELARDKIFRGETSRVIRPDLLITSEGLVICELDQIPGGMGLTAWLQKVYTASGYEIVGGPEGMLEGFRSMFSRLQPGEGVDIVISQESAMYVPEMRYLVDSLTQHFPAIPWRLLDPEYQGTWASYVYRFFELFDRKNVACAPLLLSLAQAGEMIITPPLKPQLEEKLLFALFWMKPLEGFWRRNLGEHTMGELKKMIPYSWVLTPEPLPPQAVYPRLEVQSWNEIARFSQKQRELVIKISGFEERAWGSRGVHVGHDLSKTEWTLALQGALEEYEEHPHLLQRFHHSLVQSHRYFMSDTHIMAMSGRARLTPYYFVSEDKVTLAGGLATICPVDKKILHGMSDSILTPIALEKTARQIS